LVAIAGAVVVFGGTCGWRGPTSTPTTGFTVLDKTGGGEDVLDEGRFTSTGFHVIADINPGQAEAPTFTQ
jgi:hypothetical protein